MLLAASIILLACFPIIFQEELYKANVTVEFTKSSIYDWKTIVQSFIVGGRPITIETVPYQALLFQPRKPASLRQVVTPFCGAAIISRNALLTAAHCLFGEDLTHVGVGHTDYNKATFIKVFNFGCHPLYRSNRCPHGLWGCSTYPIHDIGFIILRESLPITKNIKPVPLALKTPSTGDTAMVSGWGAKKYVNNMGMTKNLRATDVRLYQFRNCRKFKHLPALVLNTYICNQLHGVRGAFKGDSGGPVVANGQLVGVVSFGWMDKTGYLTDAYTNVAFYKSWICLKTRVGCKNAQVMANGNNSLSNEDLE